MFIAQITIQSKSEEVLDCFYELLGVWRRNGQLLNEEFPITRGTNFYRAFLMVPESDSLDGKYDCANVQFSRQKIEELSSIDVEILGEVPESAIACNCKKRSSFILFTTFLSNESPLHCGDCFGVVPLYSLCKNRAANSKAIDGVRSWQVDYQACDTLQMGCSTGEKFGIREMSQFDSSLSKRGRKICEAIEKATQTPTFYYLFRYHGRSEKRERERKCPSCGGDWRLAETLHDKFDFKCEDCRLLSNLAFSYG